MRALRLAAVAAALVASTPALAAPDYRIAPTQALKTAKAADRYEMAYIGLSVLDAAQTIYALESGKGVESNPLMGKHPTPLKIIAVKAVGMSAQYALYREVRRTNPRMALRVAQVSAVLQGAVVGLNMRVVF